MRPRKAAKTITSRSTALDREDARMALAGGFLAWYNARLTSRLQRESLRHGRDLIGIRLRRQAAGPSVAVQDRAARALSSAPWDASGSGRS